jgi:hypothetical protein
MSLTVTDILLGTVYGMWWAVSVFSQLKNPTVTKLKSKDIFHLLPNWRLFAPVPSRRDYHLEYRYKDDATALTRWKRMNVLSLRNPWQAVWNPRKRLRKAFNTSVRRIARCQRLYGYHAASKSLAYLHLLNYLEHHAFRRNARLLQFRIISAQDYDPSVSTRLVFLSSWHQQDN